jgi:hypothetical protein
VVASSNVIEYDGTFTFPVPVEQLWSTIGCLDCFPTWWSWLRDYSVDGTGLVTGTVLHGVVTPPLPYRMRLDVVLDECVPRQSIVAQVHGDLEGFAQLTFDGDERSTTARATWTIEMMQAPMRVAARFAHPVLRWGHDRVVDMTVDGFRRHALPAAR